MPFGGRWQTRVCPRNHVLNEGAQWRPSGEYDVMIRAAAAMRAVASFTVSTCHNLAAFVHHVNSYTVIAMPLRCCL